MPFIEAISSPAMRERLAVVCRENAATRILTRIIGTQELLIWAHCVGVGADAELRTRVSAVAPPELRRITAAPDEEEFLYTGLLDLTYFFELYDRFSYRRTDRFLEYLRIVGSFQPQAKLRVLDFACGCGRLSRYLAMHPEVDAYGLDVNPDLVAWCQAELPGVRTLLNPVVPPMPVGSDFFDLVFALSLFSHLPERRAIEWLADIARVIVPGGLLIVTTHGIDALEIIRNSPEHHAMFNLSEVETDVLMERLPREGFIFRPYDANTLTVAKAGDEYGNAFIDPDYITRSWNTDLLEVVRHFPHGLRGWQDCVVLRRK